MGEKGGYNELVSGRPEKICGVRREGKAQGVLVFLPDVRCA